MSEPLLADPARAAGWDAHGERVGFFTDTSICIGCKACEVACKEWNEVPEDGLVFLDSSYDNTGTLGASTWRHVAFIEQTIPLGGQDAGLAEARDLVAEEDLAGLPSAPPDVHDGFRWLMSSDVCKHCTHAACLDVCPTGALFRTEFGSVVVQPDVCNGCGYCVPTCPFGVIDRRHLPAPPGDEGLTLPLFEPEDGRVWKCTLCYDRLHVGLEPACAQACPTKSIQFGPLEQLRERARERVDTLHTRGVKEARLYGADEDDGVGGFGAFFLLLDEPEVYRLPPDPVVTTRDLGAMWKAAAAAGAALVGLVAVCAGRRG